MQPNIQIAKADFAVIKLMMELFPIGFICVQDEVLEVRDILIGGFIIKPF